MYSRPAVGRLLKFQKLGRAPALQIHGVRRLVAALGFLGVLTFENDSYPVRKLFQFLNLEMRREIGVAEFAIWAEDCVWSVVSGQLSCQ